MRFAFINGKQISPYKCSKKDKICCKNGHTLIPIQGSQLDWHFRHVGKCNSKCDSEPLRKQLQFNNKLYIK